MKKILTISILAAIQTTYAENEHILTKNAVQSAKELKINCQKLKVAKSNCVIAHFESEDRDAPLDSFANPVKKASDFYRVLFGKTDSENYLISDYYSNGQALTNPFLTSDAKGLTTRWSEAELKASSLNHTLYNKDGSKSSQFSVLAGSFEGSKIDWHKNGQVAVQSEYKNDELTGIYKTWSVGGTLTQEGQYENGEKTGLWITYGEYNGGQKTEAAEYKNGIMSGSYTEWHEDGTLSKNGQYDKDGEKTGLWQSWYTDKVKYEEETYKAGMIVGPYIRWYDNGQISEKGQYNNEGEKEGTWKAWYDNGENASVGQYKNGTQIGKWKYWDESGKLISEDDYKDGENLTPEAVEERIEERVSSAIDHITESLTETHDAEQAAKSLGTTCQVYRRKDQCVIAYFNDKSAEAVNRKSAKYYRVLHGQVGYLYIIQDFFTNGNPQSNTIFARSESGVLESFDNEELSIHGVVKTYTPQNKKQDEFRYNNGELDEYYEAAEPAAEAAAKAVDAAGVAATPYY